MHTGKKYHNCAGHYHTPQAYHRYMNIYSKSKHCKYTYAKVKGRSLLLDYATALPLRVGALIEVNVFLVVTIIIIVSTRNSILSVRVYDNINSIHSRTPWFLQGVRMRFLWVEFNWFHQSVGFAWTGDTITIGIWDLLTLLSSAVTSQSFSSPCFHQ
mgnify:CR=1 FL=1